MAKEFIVAIELGSSKMTGIAGKKNPDGSISIMAVAREDSTSCIRKGSVYNINQTAQCLTNIVTKLRNTLKTEITQVYVGVGGQGIRSIRNTIVKDLAPDTIVSVDMVNELMDANRSMTYPDYEILDAATQEYKVDAQNQTDPVGIQARHLEGNFVNILWRKSFSRSLGLCFQQAGIAIAEMYPSALVLADAVLTDSERRSGCVLIDLGADTTTVAVYYRNILRSIAVIPLGGGNVTKDLTSVPMEEATAEKMKLRYASAYTDNSDIDNALTYPIDDERSIDSRKFTEIVEARVKEIIRNAWVQVPDEYKGKLLGGIILTGGAANMPNTEKAFRQDTQVEKIRTAKYVSLNITTPNPKVSIPHDGTACTILGLLAKGNINCAGTPIGAPVQPKPAPTPEEQPYHNAEQQHQPQPVPVPQPQPAPGPQPQPAPQPKPQPKPEEPASDEENDNTEKRSSLFGRLGKWGKRLINTITEPEPNE